ncbi:MAG: hypothetical protein RLY86_2149 [Pseudomonadota bacterium]|jgi:glutathione S-transferase
MKLYGAALSPHVARVLMVVRAKGLDVPLAEPLGGGLKSPEFLAINPYGKMPVLEHGGRHIIESEVICEYLEEVFPQTRMLPEGAWERAQVRMIDRAVDFYVMPVLLGLLNQMNPVTRDRDFVEKQLVDLKRGLDGLDRLLVGPWAAGPAISLADCTLVPACFYLERFLPAFGRIDAFGDHPKVASVWAFVRKDPLVARLLADMAAALDDFMRRRAANS